MWFKLTKIWWLITWSILNSSVVTCFEGLLRDQESLQGTKWSICTTKQLPMAEWRNIDSPLFTNPIPYWWSGGFLTPMSSNAGFFDQVSNSQTDKMTANNLNESREWKAKRGTSSKSYHAVDWMSIHLRQHPKLNEDPSISYPVPLKNRISGNVQCQIHHHSQNDKIQIRSTLIVQSSEWEDSKKQKNIVQERRD